MPLMKSYVNYVRRKERNREIPFALSCHLCLELWWVEEKSKNYIIKLYLALIKFNNIWLNALRLVEKTQKKPGLRVIEKARSFCLKNKVCDKQGLCAEFWKFQNETVND